MPRNRFFHCLTLAAAFFLLWETQASAYETRVVTDYANTPLFQLRFFDQGEEYGNALSETEGEVSTWQLSAAQKDAVTQAVELWADILGPGANNAVPAAINVGTMNEVNADAISVANPTWQGTPWEGSSGLAGALIGDQSTESSGPDTDRQNEFQHSGHPVAPAHGQRHRSGRNPVP